VQLSAANSGKRESGRLSGGVAGLKNFSLHVSLVDMPSLINPVFFLNATIKNIPPEINPLQKGKPFPTCTPQNPRLKCQRLLAQGLTGQLRKPLFFSLEGFRRAAVSQAE